ncbi:MAG: GAF domain-containing protein [Tahibacter sp.]
MPAQFSAFPPDRAAPVLLLEEGRIYRVGRSSTCELQIDHFSVSRTHVEIAWEDGGWSLTDTGSKNGLRVDGHLVSQAFVEHATWFAIGDVYCWLEPLSAERADSLAAQIAVRRSTSRAMSQQLQRTGDVDALLEQTIEAVLELSGMQRGFVVFAASDGVLRVRARRGIEAQDFSQRNFAGSAAAVQRCLDEKSRIVCCDTSDSPWLGARPSVQLGGIRALTTIPLLIGDDILGAIYTDSREAGPVLTELDLELVENIAQNAAAALAAARLRSAVDSLRGDAADAGVQAPRWDEIRGAP